jgi:exopolysaccharide biosynthesis WecB/TagA/CpsF family protein
MFIGIGDPGQTHLALRLRDDPRAHALLCVGQAVEFAAGLAVRAPRWMIRARLEWLHRVLREPRRLGPRYARALLDLLPIIVGELRSRHGQRPSSA